MIPTEVWCDGKLIIKTELSRVPSVDEYYWMTFDGHQWGFAIQSVRSTPDKITVFLRSPFVTLSE
jgi:hypothetical protein